MESKKECHGDSNINFDDDELTCEWEIFADAIC
jgi:hypothetical protein